MRPTRVPNPADCSSFRTWIYPLQADELAADDRERLLSHAGECPGCARLAEVEQSFLRALRGRLQRAEAPAGLEHRIRESLALEAPDVRPGPAGWLRTPGVSALAAAVLLAALLVPALLEGPAHVDPVGTAALRVVKAMTIVDYDCDAAGRTIAQQRECRKARHLNVLKAGDGIYWNVNLDHPSAREIVFDAGRRGRRVVVEADFYPDLKTVHLIGVRAAVPDAL